MASSRREWAIAVGGGLGFAMVLVGILRGDALWPGSDPVEAPLVAATPPPAPLPPPVLMPSPPAPAPPPAMILRGVIARSGAGAAILEIGGRQRLVRVGQPVAPGIRLRAVTAGEAMLDDGVRQWRLPLVDAGGAASPAPAAAGPATGNDARLALEPVRRGGALVGWRLFDPARLPALAAAGLQPGDIVVRVGGRTLISEEAVLDLPVELDAGAGVVVQFQRAGALRSATTVAALR